MNKSLLDSCILIKPSNKMCEIIKQLKDTENVPVRIDSIVRNRKLKNTTQSNINEYVTDSKDFKFISSIDHKLSDENMFAQLLAQDVKTYSPNKMNEGYLQIEDLLWLNQELQKLRIDGHNIYLHELLKDCSIYVPGNEKIDRNPELEKRCIKLKNQQDNLKYKSMTKNVDNIRIHEPQETLAYQMKQINKQLIAVGQFIISVLAGFAFGFIGVELLVGRLDFGFRLLLGIMCALTIALAELYFLAKQLVD